MFGPANSISAELLRKALEEIGISCEEGCIHAEALGANKDAVIACLKESKEHYEENNRNGLMERGGVGIDLQYFVSGLHVGYRLAQLEITSAPTVVN
jgi:hypothetical protein